MIRLLAGIGGVIFLPGGELDVEAVGGLFGIVYKHLYHADYLESTRDPCTRTGSSVFRVN
jgi:hypothetical protein